MSAPRPRIDLFYPFVPHYRHGVFTELLADDRATYRVLAGATSPVRTIPIVAPEVFADHVRVRNVWFGPLLVQPYALWHALTTRADAVVHVGDVRYASTWLAAAILRARRKRVLFWTIGWHRPEQGLKRRARIAFYRLADGLLLYGQRAAEIGRALGYPAGRIAVIGNSHDVRAPRAGARRPAVHWLPPDDVQVVGAVIRPNANKRLDLLLQAAARLRAAGRLVHVCVVGEGPCRQELGDLARRLNVPVSLPGACHDPEVLATVYERMAVTVVPEAVGLTAVQSLWYGRPVVTSDDPHRQMPEYEAVRPGTTGSLYRAGDVDDLASHIACWLDRMGTDRAAVESDCRAEARRWSSTNHAARVTDAVLASLRPARPSRR